MLFDFFENLTGDYDVAYLMTNLIVLIGVVFLFITPFLIPVFRNSYFIDKMNKKNKRQSKSFDTQLSKLLGETGRSDELSECKREIEELKKEIARLKKAKK